MRSARVHCGVLLVLAGCAPVAGPEPAAPPAGTSYAAAERAPAPGGDGPRAVRSFSEFRPSRDGFAFVNSFSGSSLPIDLGAAAEISLGLPRRFGLCGGMSSAAVDYFIAGAPVPASTRPPARGTPLYNYLYQRQTASMGPSGAMALKFLEWMRLPDDGPDGCRARTAAELPAIRVALERGEPVIIGLVLTSAARHQEPWNNHQVLAYAISSRTAAAAPQEIRIYDPNFPGRDDVVIRISGDPGEPVCSRVAGRRETVVRGFFRMPYSPAATFVHDP